MDAAGDTVLDRLLREEEAEEDARDEARREAAERAEDAEDAGAGRSDGRDAPRPASPDGDRRPRREERSRGGRPTGDDPPLFPDRATAVAGPLAVALLAVGAAAVTVDLAAAGLSAELGIALFNLAGAAAAALLAVLAARHALDPVVRPRRLDDDPARAKAKRDLAMELTQAVLVVLVGLAVVVGAAALAQGLTLAEVPDAAVDAFRSLYASVLAAFAAVVVAALVVRTWGPGARRVRPASAAVPLAGGLGALAGAAVLQTGLVPGLGPAHGVFAVNAGLAVVGAYVLWTSRFPSPLSAFVAQLRQLPAMRRSLRTRLMLVGALAGAFSLVGLTTAVVLAGGTGVLDLADPLSLAAAVTAILVTATLITIFAFLITGKLTLEAEAEAAATEDPRVGADKRWSPAEMRRAALLAGSAVAGGLLALLTAVTALGLLPVDPTFANDLAVAAILAGIGPIGLDVYLRRRRIEEIEDKFPDLLRDLNESQKAGMTLPEALRAAARQNYGVLTEEVRKMAAEISWGVSFETSLKAFADRVGTPLVKRSVALILQATRAGGDVDEILSAAARDAREIRAIEQERRLGLSIYVMIVYIAFGVFLVVVAIMASTFIPAMAEAGTAAASTSVGTIGLSAADPRTFNLIFFHAAVIQALGGGLVAGVMGEGYPQAGLKHAVVLLVVAYVAFRLLIGL